jgi:RNA polymerase sigma factor (sigma-70 family)
MVHGSAVMTRVENDRLQPFLPFLPLATRYAARKISANEVDDMVQESLLRILAARAGAITHPKAYLMMTLRAVIVDHLRHNTSTRRSDHCELTEAHHPVDVINPCRVLIAQQDFAQFKSRFEALPPRTREILFAVRVEGLTMKAAADRFGVCLSTVEKQVARALTQLADPAD